MINLGGYLSRVTAVSSPNFKGEIMNIKKTKNNVSIFNLFMQLKDAAKVYLIVKGKKLCIVDDENLSEADVKIQPEQVSWY